jgi:hypothetical protein
VWILTFAVLASVIGIFINIYYQKRQVSVILCQKRPATVLKETCYSVKRDLLQCQKRPTTGSKETYHSVKRDLLQCQKRPATVSKETYYFIGIFNNIKYHKS